MVRSTSRVGLMVSALLAIIAAAGALLVAQPSVVSAASAGVPRYTIAVNAPARTVTVTERSAASRPHTRTFQLAQTCTSVVALNCASTDQVVAAQQLVGASIVAVSWDERGVLMNDRLVVTLAGGEQIALEITWAIEGW